jgi:hypothetical protein
MITYIAGIASALVCLGGMSIPNAATAMGCFNPDLPQRSLARDDRPGKQHDYDDIAKLGNRCKTPGEQVSTTVTQPSLPQPRTRTNNNSRPNAATAMGCLNPDLPQRSLARDDRPSKQHDYDDIAKLGNRCKTPEAQVSTTVTQPSLSQPQTRTNSNSRAPQY